MLRKRVAVLVAAAVMVLSMLVVSAPAFAQDFQHANPHANCVGQMHSTTNQFLPGHAGTFHRLLSHMGPGENADTVTFFAHFWQPGSETRSVGAFFVVIGDGYVAACAPG